jgi:hypothetical protein
LLPKEQLKKEKQLAAAKTSSLTANTISAEVFFSSYKKEHKKARLRQNTF